MAITDVTNEVESLRKAGALFLKIERLSAERCQFLLKSLVIAGHVDEWIMERGVALAETVKGHES